MAENRVNTLKTKEEPKPAPKKNNSRPARNFVRFMNFFGDLNRNQVVHAMPFILFITTLLIVYIANSYYAEGLIRSIDRTKKEVKERRAEYISTMSRLMYHRNQSEMAKALEPFDIRESTEPPGKIFIPAEKK